MKSVGHLVLMLVLAQAAQSGWTDQVRGQLYPEKRTYLVGEPVFVVLDLTNLGSQPAWISMSCAWLDTRFEAPTAAKPHRGVSLFGCAGGGKPEVAAGASRRYPRANTSRGATCWKVSSTSTPQASIQFGLGTRSTFMQGKQATGLSPHRKWSLNLS